MHNANHHVYNSPITDISHLIAQDQWLEDACTNIATIACVKILYKFHLLPLSMHIMRI